MRRGATFENVRGPTDHRENNLSILYPSFDKLLSFKNILIGAVIYFVLKGVECQHQINYGKTVKQGKERIESTLRRNSSAFKKVDKIRIQKQYKNNIKTFAHFIRLTTCFKGNMVALNLKNSRGNRRWTINQPIY